MFKVLVLQQLQNLSDDKIEYQIWDRFSFMRFWVYNSRTVCPAKTVWLFRERLKGLNLDDVLFADFLQQLADKGAE